MWILRVRSERFKVILGQAQIHSVYGCSSTVISFPLWRLCPNIHSWLCVPPCESVCLCVCLCGSAFYVFLFGITPADFLDACKWNTASAAVTLFCFFWQNSFLFTQTHGTAFVCVGVCECVLLSDTVVLMGSSLTGSRLWLLFIKTLAWNNFFFLTLLSYKALKIVFRNRWEYVWPKNRVLQQRVCSLTAVQIAILLLLAR